MNNRKLIVIAGPTACGKTRLGVGLAHQLGSEILSADSRQVYRGMDIGTGKDLAEYAAFTPPVPYHMIDIADPEQVFTLFHYQQACYEILRQRDPTDPPLVMVGGTGLYIEAVLKDYRIANVPENIVLRERLMAQEKQQLCERLSGEDPDLYGRTDTTSIKRIVRALEIVEYSREHEVQTSKPLGFDLDATVFCIQIERSKLYQLISRRVDARLEEGMVDEVQRLIDRGLSRQRLEMLGMEYREIAAFVHGDKSYDQMVKDLKQAIRHLAKRQQTWFRGMERRGVPVRFVPASEFPGCAL